MNLLLIPIFYIIFVTTIICLIHTFVPDYPMNRINIFSPRARPRIIHAPRR